MSSFKIKILTIAFAIILIIMNCNSKPHTNIWNNVEQSMNVGNFSMVKNLTDSVKQSSVKYDANWIKADSFQQICNRISIDFKYFEEDIVLQLKEKLGKYSKEDKQYWEQNNLLEYKIINGEKKYFRNSVPNLIRKIKPNGEINSLDIFRIEDTKKVVSQSKKNGSLINPVKLKISYTVSLDENAVPNGKIVRCWLPLPKNVHKRHADLQIISTSEKNYIISADTAHHHSIYMEKKAQSGKKTQFKIEYSYVSSAQYFNPENMKIQSYDKKLELYKNNVKEEKPHIVFSEKIKKLADSIVGNEQKPFEIVSKLYKWIDKNIPWASALEYSTIKCIPEYAIENMKGDCGIKTLLFMSMARYKGIPVKWQSGWMMHPGNINLHDWCELFYQGVGWVPVDMSFGLQKSDNKQIREFYISGIDAYRMIVNDAIGKEFYPNKKFLRSEPWDFQRGELEWEEGNLYFDKWHYNLQIISIN